MAFVVIFTVFIVLLAAVSPLIFLQVRKVFREQKNFERGLKMVPLLIHLPPPSDDTEVGSRDVRDVVDENISKAEVLYGIISSTFKKGFKGNFYGQRHFSFEIIGTKGRVQFYAAVPVALVDVVKQAVISAYPAARMEEISEYNIFSPIGKISGTIGGELTLKENFAYPIETYQELKRDAMQPLLNALSSLEKEDGVGIQIMMRPANPDWRKSAHAFASAKRDGKGKKKGGVGTLNTFLTAFVKPPNAKKSDGGAPDKPQLSSLDQNVADAIDAKTRFPGFEVLIRVVASSDAPERSRAIQNSIVATFALFDAPGKNGFKFTPAKDMERFVASYIMRFFAQESNQSILNSVELATIFHFPDQNSIPTSQLERQASKQVDGPRNVSEEGLLLGYNVFRGVKKPIRLTLEDRRRHMYTVGQTGTGKSTFLENLAVQDMLNGDGFAFVDPHGDTAEKLLAMVPKERTEDVIYFCPAEMDYPSGLNLFEYDLPEQKDFLIQEAINMLYKLYDPQRQGIIGPRFERIFTNCALLLMADPIGGTFVDIPKLLIDPEFMKAKLKYVTDRNVLDFWTKEWPNSQRSNEAGEVTSWVVSKFGAFLSNEMMRNIIGQQKSSFDLREIMDNKKILLVNLSKGRTGELNSKLLGMIFVMKFQAAAMSRANIPESERLDFCLYVDEFQNFATDSFATIMSEARKYRLNLIVGNQFTTQLSEEIRDAVFGNMGTIVSFRVGQNDVDALTKYFQPTFDAEDLLRVPNYNTITRTLIGGVPTQPFSMSILPPMADPNKELSQALRQLSAAKYGRPRAKVEAEIFDRLSTKEAPKTPTNRVFSQANQGAANKQPISASSGSSFLDDWMAKKNTGTPAAVGVSQSSLKPQVNGPTPFGAVSTAKTAQQPPVVVQSAATGYQPDNGTANISNNRAEQEEVDSIASQLRQNMRPNPSTAQSIADINALPAPNSSTEGTIHIGRDGKIVE